MEKSTTRLQALSTYTDKLDIIGDIHGCYHTLTDLLQKLGYSEKHGVWQHPTRLALFIGDYIDRGIYTKQVLELIKKMVDSGTAVALLGNHEYNFIAINTYDENGQPYRSPKKLKQHGATLKSLGTPDQYQKWIEWFKDLPLFVELENLRIVHACWHQPTIDFLRQHFPSNRLADNLIPALKRGSKIFDALMYVLKGPEIEVPDFLPADSPMRSVSGLRIKWWEFYSGRPTYKQVIIDPMPDIPVNDEFFNVYKPYGPDEKPVIFGHYTIPSKPYILRPNATCIDFSAYKKYYLAAYRYNGEPGFSAENLVYVPYNQQDIIE